MKPRTSSSEKSYGQGIKVPLDRKDSERVDEIIDFLRDTNTEMWSLSGA